MTNTIPQSVLEKIKEAARVFCKKEPINSDAINVKFTHPDYHMGALVAFNAGAEFAFELDKWISVKDGLPEQGERVLAYGEVSGHYCVAYLNVNNIWKNLFGIDVYGVTHYQYLPKPPIK